MIGRYYMMRALKVLKVTAEIFTPYLPMYKPLQEMETPHTQVARRKRISVQEGKHYFVVGKTELIKEMIGKKVSVQPNLNIYHLDTKKRGDFTSADGIMFQTEKAPAAFKTMGNRMVWQPFDDNKHEYSKFLLDILNNRLPTVVNVDEAINMTIGGIDNIPSGLKILLAQGRLPGIHVFGGTQEVARSPRQMHSQAYHVISFNVINDYDERMMLKMLRLNERGMKKLGLKQYEFWHIRPDVDDKAQLYHSWEELVNKII